MAQRTLELTLISAKDLKEVNLLSKMEVYAVVSLSGDPRSRQRIQTDRTGGRNPTWNAPLRFTVPANGAGSLHVLLRAERALGDRDVGEVHIPLSELLNGAPDGPVPAKWCGDRAREMMDAAAGLGRYWGVGGRRCGACAGGSPAAVHCRTCVAYLCAGCDAGHARAGHERVWVCEVCERAPAAVTCRADAAALCAACDADIHDANPLARRHERVPVQPIGSSAPAVAADVMLFGAVGNDDVFIGGGKDAATAGIFGAVDGGAKGADGKLDFLFADVMDPFLGAAEVARFTHADSVVPNNNIVVSNAVAAAKAKPSSYSSYTAASLAHSGSSSEVGLVPDAICGRGGSVTGGVIELDFAQSKAAYLPYATTPTHSVSSVDAGAVPERSDGAMAGRVVATAESREARLMRYREKRKNRRFEKTIRYASRKAYAETRPRVKGRFAKRNDDNESDADVAVNVAAVAAPAPPPPTQPAYSYLLDFSGYGVVPSF